MSRKTKTTEGSFFSRLGQRWSKKLPKNAKRSAEKRIAVLTDSTSGLSGNGEDLFVIQTPVIINDTIVGQSDEDTLTPIALAFAEGKSIKTSRPSPGAFTQLYQHIADTGFDAIVSVHISTHLSGTYDSATLAAAKASIPVQVVDSHAVAGILAASAEAALLAAREGRSLEQCAAAALEHTGAQHLLCYVPTLDYLRKGGRISASAGFFGGLLDVKPLLHLKDGKIELLEKVRTATRALGHLSDRINELLPQHEGVVDITIHYFGRPDEPGEHARALAASLSKNPRLRVRFSPIPAVLAAHAGPGVLAVVF